MLDDLQVEIPKEHVSFASERIDELATSIVADNPLCDAVLPQIECKADFQKDYKKHQKFISTVKQHYLQATEKNICNQCCTLMCCVLFCFGFFVLFYFCFVFEDILCLLYVRLGALYSQQLAVILSVKVLIAASC